VEKENNQKDASIIPVSDYFCCQIVEIQPNEILSTDRDRFGKDLREFHYYGNDKEILCPYWFLTNHNTVRCEFLDIEDDMDSLLADEQKICNLNFEN
jgi:hypothetical protein